MRFDAQQKVTASHVQRDAYLYIRQSTLRQVVENTESTQRQYALKQQALRLGWPIEQVIVIDSDLGQSGASAVDREGFQRLVTEVSLGHAGIVLGLEVSRSRNSTDWHRLLEICALTDTLILDEDGLYDPRHFNDRLLLGLKGTISEAELHILRTRLLGGIESKARRGELRKPLPIGLDYDAQNRVVLDPDQQVQQALATFFREFERIGAAMGVVRYFRQQKLQFPRRVRRGVHKGQLLWAPLTHSLALKLLKNPRYAGCYVHGQSRRRENAGWQASRSPRASGSMGHGLAPSPPRLHHLGTVSKQSSTPVAKRHGARWWRRAAPSSARRPGAAPGVGPLRSLWPAFDHTLPPLQGKPSCNVHVSTRWDRERGAVLSVYTGRRNRP